MGLNVQSDRVYPDLAFALPVPLLSREQDTSSASLKICIGAMHYQGWRGHLETDDSIYVNYLAKLEQFALWLLDRNNSVTLIMGDERDERAVVDLRQTILAKRPALPEGRLSAEIAHSRRDVMNQMSDADVVIATRFHSLVFALMLGKLTISTGYSDYHSELMEVSGLGEFCQHSDNFSVETMIAQFTELVSNRTRYQKLIQERARAARESLEEQDTQFAESFLQPCLGKR